MSDDPSDYIRSYEISASRIEVDSELSVSNTLRIGATTINASFSPVTKHSFVDNYQLCEYTIIEVPNGYKYVGSLDDKRFCFTLDIHRIFYGLTPLLIRKIAESGFDRELKELLDE
jgi:hypothetical protein